MWFPFSCPPEPQNLMAEYYSYYLEKLSKQFSHNFILNNGCESSEDSAHQLSFKPS